MDNLTLPLPFYHSEPVSSQQNYPVIRHLVPLQWWPCIDQLEQWGTWFKYCSWHEAYKRVSLFYCMWIYGLCSGISLCPRSPTHCL